VIVIKAMMRDNYYYRNLGARNQAYIDSVDLIGGHITILSSSLNKIHKTNHSPRYWRIILLPWLRYLVDNYQHNLLVNNLDDSNFRQLIVSPVSIDYEHFLEMIIDKAYRKNINSLMAAIDDFQLDDIEYVYKGVPSKQKQKSKSFKVWFCSVISVLTRVSGFIFYKRKSISLDYFDPRLFLSLFIEGVNPLFLGCSKVDESHIFTADKKLRVSLFLSGIEEGCEKVNIHLWKTICALIPLSYLENYKDISRSSGYVNVVPDVILTKNIHSDDRYKQWIASTVEHGAKLIVVQHGGGYGINCYDFTEDIETLNSDVYLSYISSVQRNIKQVPADKYIKYEYDQASERVLLVNVVYPSFYKYHSGPIGNQLNQNIDDQIEFISILNQSVLGSLSVRQYPYTYDMPVQEKYQQSGFDIYEENEICFYSLIKDSRLVVLSYIGTTWLETLMNNIPTVVFINPEHWEARDTVQPFMDQLRKVGILHDSPQSAALHINNTVNHIENWWSGNDLQTIRRKFCKNYAYTDKRWRDVWAKTITDMIKQDFYQHSE
jgi:putative transferase (TIGR04331 family)